MDKNFTSTVAGASILLTTVGLIGKSLGFIREIVFADYFGLNTRYNLYLVGAVLPLTINSIIFYIAQNYFIPNYNKLKVEKPGTAKALTSSIYWLFTAGAAAFSLLLYFFSRSIISFYLQNQTPFDIEIALNVFRIFLITIPLNTSFAVLAAYMQAELKFKYPAYSQLFMNAAVIILVMLFADKAGVYTIPLGYAAGSLFQLAFLLIKSRGSVIFNIKELFRSEEKLFIIKTSFIIIIIIESISQMFLFADRYFYNSVDKGGIASLNYAMNIYLLPVTIFSLALTTAIFPKLSLLYNSSRKEDLQNTVNNFYSINLLLFVPISAVLFFYGNLIIRILFQRGEFSPSDTLLTFNVLRYYTISLIFFSTYAVMNKLLYSANLVKSLLIITVAGCLIKAVMNFILVGHYRQTGLAVSTTISYLFFFVSALAVASFKLKLSSTYFFKELLFSAANTLFSISIANILISSDLIKSPLLNGIIRLVVFAIIYSINLIISKHNSLNLFQGALGYFRQKEVKAS